MSLFVQELKIGISNQNYVIEKIQVSVNKSKIDLYVAPGTYALINGVKYKGDGAPYKLTSDDFGAKSSQATVYLYPDKYFDAVSVNFFGGQHVVSLSAMPTAKGKFSIVGTAVIEVADYKDLANYYGRTITKDEIAADIITNFRSQLTNEISASASKFITPETTEITLKASLDNIVADVMSSGRKTATTLMNMGLMLSKRGISLHVNALDEADETMKKITEALSRNAVDQLNEPQRQREIEEQERLHKQEIDRIRAENTKINETKEETTRNINTNGNGNVVINEGKRQPTNTTTKVEKRFCPECGKEVTKDAKFCKYCGHKL